MTPRSQIGLLPVLLAGADGVRYRSGRSSAAGGAGQSCLAGSRTRSIRNRRRHTRRLVARTRGPRSRRPDRNRAPGKQRARDRGASRDRGAGTAEHRVGAKYPQPQFLAGDATAIGASETTPNTAAGDLLHAIQPRCRRRLGDRLLGPVPARHRSGRCQPAGVDRELRRGGGAADRAGRRRLRPDTRDRRTTAPGTGKCRDPEAELRHRRLLYRNGQTSELDALQANTLLLGTAADDSWSRSVIAAGEECARRPARATPAGSSTYWAARGRAGPARHALPSACLRTCCGSGPTCAGGATGCRTNARVGVARPICIRALH